MKGIGRRSIPGSSAGPAIRLSDTSPALKRTFGPACGSINHHQRAGGLADEGSAGSTIDTSHSHPSHARVIVSTAIRLAFASRWDSGLQKNESIGAQRNWPMATSPIATRRSPRT